MSNCRPTRWWIPYIKSAVGIKNIKYIKYSKYSIVSILRHSSRPNLKAFLNFLKGFSLLKCKSSLFLSRMVQGKKEYLKTFVLQNYVPAEYVEQVSYVLFYIGIIL